MARLQRRELSPRQTTLRSFGRSAELTLNV